MGVCWWRGYGSGLVARGNNNDDRLRNVNANNQPSNRLGMASSTLRASVLPMETYSKFFHKLCDYDNLLLAFIKARKRKTKKEYVQQFEANLANELYHLQWELLTHAYKPRPMTTFTVRDPKTRKICSSDFRDRVIHHAICNVIEPIFDKRFIHDTFANRKGKGTLAALKRFDFFMRKVTGNGRMTSRERELPEYSLRLRPQGGHQALFRNGQPQGASLHTPQEDKG